MEPEMWVNGIPVVLQDIPGTRGYFNDLDGRRMAAALGRELETETKGNTK